MRTPNNKSNSQASQKEKIIYTTKDMGLTQSVDSIVQSQDVAGYQKRIGLESNTCPGLFLQSYLFWLLMCKSLLMNDLTAMEMEFLSQVCSGQACKLI